jgi:serine protease Do
MNKLNARFRMHVLFVFIVTVTIFIIGILWLKTEHHHYKQMVKSEKPTTLIDSSEDLLFTTKNHTEKQLKKLIQEAQPKVVTIEVIKDDGLYFGSGFLYNSEGDIVTNAHVVDGATEITIKLADETEYSGKLIGVGKGIDIAVIRVKELAGMEPLKISRRYNGEIGNHVVALGSPLGLENTVTIGIISGLDRSFTLQDYEYVETYQISAPISPGSSGGPLLDRTTGEVIGINSAKVNSETIGFSIPVVTVLPILENWSKHPYGMINTNNDDSPPKYNDY